MKGRTEVQIDWSKAPENYPFWVEAIPPCHSSQSGWHHEKNGHYYDQDGLYWTPEELNLRYRVYRRPEREVWTGEGLPPVGTICQFVSDMEDGSDWYPGLKSGATVEVVAHFHTGLADVAAFVFDNLDSRQVEQARAECFRPFKTAEQIAAEARQEQIDQILADAGVTGSAFDGDPEAEVWAAALLDAGYRKVEGAP